MMPVEGRRIVVVGAGPAGLAAACCAAECGMHVQLIDDNPDVGGQIWRAARADASPESTARLWFDRFDKAQVELHAGTTIVGTLDAGHLLAVTQTGESRALPYDRLILAAGARELFLPLPGWTLPGVFGAGGFQALVKSGLPIKGRRVIVAGSGPLLLAVTSTLLAHGAEVALVAEQAPWRRIVRFALHLLRRHFRKFREGISLRRSLRRTPYRTGCWVRSCLGKDKLEAVAMTDGTRHWVEPCDYLACGFGLVPNLELPLLLGCELQGKQVAVDEHQRTSVDNVWVAGELCGIGGLELALVEGQIAGYAAADEMQRAGRLLRLRKRHRQFAARLRGAFALRSELFRLAESETVICRCEDVPYSVLRGYCSWREAKLHSRCGMGPCQGRICGPAVEHLFGWTVDSVRPPLLPAPIAALHDQGPMTKGMTKAKGQRPKE